MEDRQMSAPSAQHIQRSFCLHPSLVSCRVLGHPGWPPGPPKCSVCVWSSELCDGCSFRGVAAPVPSHSHPSPARQTLQVQYLPGQRLCGPSILPWPTPPPPASSPQEWLCRACCCVCMFVPVASCHVPTSAVDRVPRGQGPASLPSSFFCS